MIIFDQKPIKLLTYTFDGICETSISDEKGQKCSENFKQLKGKAHFLNWGSLINLFVNILEQTIFNPYEKEKKK
uniref:Uncharacterized protein n=1 Tax=Glossina austeni TaxID=7395 RepID=A0A1A9UUE9_GLOAU